MPILPTPRNKRPRQQARIWQQINNAKKGMQEMLKALHHKRTRGTPWSLNNKKDGRSEPFDRNKLIRGILKACEKRPVRREKIESAVNDIEQNLRLLDRTEIPSRPVGDMVVERLKAIDEIAYVRFASVYKRFTEASQFAEAAREVAKFNKSAPQKYKEGGTRRITASAPL